MKNRTHIQKQNTHLIEISSVLGLEQSVTNEASNAAIVGVEDPTSSSTRGRCKQCRRVVHGNDYADKKNKPNNKSVRYSVWTMCLQKEWSSYIVFLYFSFISLVSRNADGVCKNFNVSIFMCGHDKNLKQVQK